MTKEPWQQRTYIEFYGRFYSQEQSEVKNQTGIEY